MAAVTWLAPCPTRWHSSGTTGYSPSVWPSRAVITFPVFRSTSSGWTAWRTRRGGRSSGKRRTRWTRWRRPRGTSPNAWTTWRVTSGNGRRREKQRRSPQRPPTASQSRRANLQSRRANLRSPPPNRGRLLGIGRLTLALPREKRAAQRSLRREHRGHHRSRERRAPRMYLNSGESRSLIAAIRSLRAALRFLRAALRSSPLRDASSFFLLCAITT